MPVEFSPMFSPANAHNLYFVEDGGEPVSLVGMLPGKIRVHGVSVSVASMGSVCTLEPYRKHHLASRMVEQAIRDFAQDTSLLLVSGGLSIYRRVGCVDFGDWLGVVLGPVDKPDPRVAVEAGLMESDSFHALYSAEPLRFARTPSQMEVLLATTSAPQFRAQATSPQVFAARREGRVIAYAVAIHPDKRPEIVHLLEWAGDRTAIAHLADAALRYYGADRVHLAVARTDVTLAGVLAAHECEWREEANQGTLRVLNPDLLLREMGPLIEERFGARLGLTASGTDETWTVDWDRTAGDLALPDQGVRLEGFAALSDWLFGRRGLNLPLPRTDDLNYI